MSEELSYHQSRKDYIKAKNKRYREKHKDELKAYKKRYREEHKDELKAYEIRYRETHKEEFKAYGKRYRDTHKEELKIKQKIYDDSRKESRKIKDARRNSYKRGLGYSPLNSYFLGSHIHHLHEESNTSFCVYIPSFLHELIPHVSKTGTRMQSINAVALSYWLIDYQFFKDD